MTSVIKCIVCGDDTNGKFYLGKKRSMDVTLCESHKDFCEGCERVAECDGASLCEALR